MKELQSLQKELLCLISKKSLKVKMLDTFGSKVPRVLKNYYLKCSKCSKVFKELKSAQYGPSGMLLLNKLQRLV